MAHERNNQPGQEQTPAQMLMQLYDGLTPEQKDAAKTVLLTFGGLLAAGGLLALFNREKAAELTRKAEQRAQGLIDKIGADTWAVMKQHALKIAEEGPIMFKEHVIDPLAKDLADEFARRPLNPLLEEGINLFKRALKDHPLRGRMQPPTIQRVPIVDADKDPQS